MEYDLIIDNGYLCVVHKNLRHAPRSWEIYIAIDKGFSEASDLSNKISTTHRIVEAQAMASVAHQLVIEQFANMSKTNT